MPGSYPRVSAALSASPTPAGPLGAALAARLQRALAFAAVVEGGGQICSG
jgi:hypothetical protein